jgi:hypothetical protein
MQPLGTVSGNVTPPSLVYVFSVHGLFLPVGAVYQKRARFVVNVDSVARHGGHTLYQKVFSAVHFENYDVVPFV